MFQVTITQEMGAAAFKKSQEMGVLYNSILGGAGNMAGFLGEFAVAEALGAEVCNTLDYDLMLDGKKIDVKTKQSKPKPKPEYEASLADFNTDQDCDYYLFARVVPTFQHAWVLGFYPKHKYIEDATFHEKGEYDFSNGFKFRADCHNLRHDALIGWDADTAEEFKQVWRSLHA